MFLLVILNSFYCFSQETIEIKGKITDKNDISIPGANIIEKGTTNGTVSDLNGLFKLKVSSQNKAITVSFIGYLSQEIMIDGKSDINIVLVEDISNIDEVVVIGYGTVKKGDVTGSVTVVNTKDLTNTPTHGALGSLQGKAAGVRVVSNSGQPGAEPMIWVRGLNSISSGTKPLFIVDGMHVNSINFLNPSDIASIDILKDASSAAIYGSRGSAGVILITTKRGSNSDEAKHNISFDSYIGFVRAGNSPNLYNAYEYLEFRRRQDLDDNTQNSEFADIDALLNDVQLATGSIEGTNWWKEVQNNNATVQNYNLSLDGGNSSIAYASSINYTDQDGIIQASNFKKWSWKLNTDIKVSRNLNFSTNLIITDQYRTALSETNNGSYGILSSVYGTDPTGPVFRDPNNPAHASSMYGYDQNNPYSWYFPSQYTSSTNPMLSIARQADDYSKSTRIIGGLSANIHLTQNLTFNSTFSMEKLNQSGYNFDPLYAISPNNQKTLTSLDQDYSFSNSWVWSNMLSYKRILGKNDLNLLAGFSSEKENWEFISANKSDPLNRNQEEYRVLSMFANKDLIDGNNGFNTLISYIGRAIYSYDNKYIANFTIRKDGSSKFNRGQRWGTFPSLSLAWKFSEEKFLKETNLNWLSFGKIFMGWGQLGNQSIPGNSLATQYAPSEETRLLFGSGNGNEVIGIAAKSIGNPLLEWETAEQINVGLDVGLFQNQLFITAEYYYKQNKDLLFRVAAPKFAGWANEAPYSNIGVMLNKGFDLQVSFRKQLRTLKIEITGNVDKYKNEITDLAWMKNISAGSWLGTEISRIEEGNPVGFFYGYEFEGVFQNEEEIQNHPMSNGRPGLKPGDLKFKDINNDTFINDEDRTMIGNPHPDFSYGLNSSFAYKSFDLNLFIQGTQGNDIYDFSGKINTPDILDLAWRAAGTLGSDDQGNPTNSMYRISKTSLMNDQINSLWVKNGSYMRLKTIQFGYTLPENWINKLKIKSLRIYISGQNMLTLTKYDGLDPEIGQTYSNPSGSLLGVNIFSYPQPKTLTVGVNVKF